MVHQAQIVVHQAQDTVQQELQLLTQLNQDLQDIILQDQNLQVRKAQQAQRTQQLLFRIVLLELKFQSSMAQWEQMLHNMVPSQLD
jgi:hypothetical protein